MLGSLTLARGLFAQAVAMAATFTTIAFSASAQAANVDSLSWDGLEARLDTETAFSGVVLVARGGEIVTHRAFGMANREKEVANTPETIFAVGSTPIDFTRAGILLLVERDEIQLSDSIASYFDDVPADKRAMTLDHLMSGRSGLPDFHDVASDRDPDHGWVDRDAAVRRILGADLLFAPGEGRRHSHSAWGLLAAVIEIASGQSYQGFTAKHLFAPAGMSDTGFFGEPIPQARLAIGYGARRDGEINAPPYWGRTSWLVMGSGGMTSTLGDLFRWNQALRAGRVLAADSVAAYWSAGEGICRAGNMYGFEIAYTEGGSGAQMIVVSNASFDGEKTLDRLAADLAGLVNGVGAKLAEGPDFPVTVQGRRARAFFTAFNSEEIDAYVAFGREHRAAVADQVGVDAARGGQRREWLEWGRLEVGSVVTRPARIEVIARGSADGMWRKFMFRFEAAAPHRIDSLAIDMGVEPPGAGGSVRGQRLDPTAPWEDLKELLTRARDISGMPGLAAAVVRGGKIVDSATVGVRRIDEDDRVGANDVFHWGSVGKSLTGTVIGRLIQDGVFEPTLTMGEAFPELQVHEGYRGVTLEQLMCHRGGVPSHTTGGDIFGAGEGTDGVAARALFVAELLRQSPASAVGAMRYSNAGIAVAAHAAETLAGTSWEDLLREHVFTPAGMETAGHGWPRSVGRTQPNGHRLVGEGFEPTDDLATPFSLALAPAGNVHSSIDDFARYAMLHLNGLAGRDGYFDAATIQRLHQPLAGPGEKYAFGWAIDTFPGTDVECHWHNGSAGTFLADVKLVPERDLGIVIMMNGFRPGSSLEDEIAEAIWFRYGR